MDSLTNDEAIEYYYNNNLVTSTDYTSEYYKNTNNVSLYTDEGEVVSLYENYLISENGTSEFILKNSDGEVIGFEKITINYLQPGDKLVVKSEEEMSKWKTDGNGNIIGYTGEETELTIPIYIGTEKITGVINLGLRTNSKIEKVILTDSIVGIAHTFKNARYIKEVVLSNNLELITATAFSRM